MGEHNKLRSLISYLSYLLCLLISSAEVYSQQLPIITKHPSNGYAAKGKAHTLSCKFDPDTHATVTWYRNGTKIPTQYDNPSSHRSLTEDGDLFFLKFSAEDAGWYYCNGTNTAGYTLSSNATIQIAVLREEFIVNPTATSAVLGSRATLSCQPPRGTPDPQVHWTRNGSLLDVDRDGRLTIESPPGTLILRSVQSVDQGLYVCVAVNEAGERYSESAMLTVLEPPVFTTVPIPRIEHEGREVRFRCIAEGDPKPNVTWVKKNDKLVSGRSRVLEDNTLVISDLEPSDEGDYTCTATNLGGVVSADGYLTVYTAPVFLETPRTKTIRKGSLVTFRCVVSGNPPPALSWSKIQEDSLQLYARQTKGRFSVLEDGSLQIINSKMVDSGEYKCFASNAAGTNDATASLRVRDQADTRPPPIITKQPRNVTVTLSKDVELQCKASGNPSPTITWKHNGLPVLDDSRISINRGNLRISDVMVTDGGKYTCLADSESGEASAFAYLNVLGATRQVVQTLIPSTPEMPSASERDIKANSVKLYWGASSGHSTALTYSVEYFTLDDQQGWQVAVADVTDTWAVIDDLESGTSYVMLVRAHNSYGTSEPSPLSDYIMTLGSPSRSRTIPWVSAQIEANLNNTRVNLLSADALTSTDINITWRLPRQHRRFVEGFYVIVAGDPLTRKVYGSSSNYHILSRLNPYTRYSVRVTPFYRQYIGTPSRMLTTSTMEDVPSGPPTSVEVKEIDSERNVIQVSWSPPKISHQNGEITGYVIVCAAENPKLSRNFSVYSNITNVALENLNRNTLYKIGVAATTKVGAGAVSQMWPIEARLSPVTVDKEGSAWWKHMLIGAVGGLVWVVLCILIICLCRRRRALKKASKQSGDEDIVSVPLQTASNSNGLVVQYKLDHSSKSQQLSMSHPQSMSPQGAEFMDNLRFHTSYNEQQNMDNYDEPQFKTFYNKSDSMSTGPYATTVILNGMPERDENGIPRESPHVTLNPKPVHGSESSCTDNNASRPGAISNSSGERASPPVLPSFTDILPPPPLYPPPLGGSNTDRNPANYQASPRSTQAVAAMVGTLPQVAQVGPTHCHTCHRGYHNSGMGVEHPRPQYMLDNQVRAYNPTLPHIHSFPGANEYQTTYPSMPRTDCKHSYQPYNICSPHGHSSDSHDYAEPQFDCTLDRSIYGGMPAPPLLQHQHQLRNHQHPHHHTMQHPDTHKPVLSYQTSMPAHLHGAQLLAHETQAPPGSVVAPPGAIAGRHHSLPSSEHSHELCMSCAEHTEYDEPWTDQHWSMIWDPNHSQCLHQQHQLKQAAENEEDDDEEGVEETPMLAGVDETTMLAGEQGSAASSAEGVPSGSHTGQSRSGSEDSKSGRQRQKRRQRAQQLPMRPTSPYNGYSTDSSVQVFVPRKPYPKSQRKKQMNAKPKSTKSLAVQVEQEELHHDKV